MKLVILDNRIVVDVYMVIPNIFCEKIKFYYGTKTQDEQLFSKNSCAIVMKPYVFFLQRAFHSVRRGPTSDVAPQFLSFSSVE